MKTLIEKWILDPVTGKIILTIVFLMVLIVSVRFARNSISRYIKDTDTRYRARKFITFMGYIIAVLIIITIYSDKLGGLHVAFGVAGAGIAFSLQEVIVSIAGWISITFGNFYKTGDRIQLGGIRGDVIDIGILRTTLMEVGEWVNGDLYNGRISRIANSFVLKEPVFNYSGEFPFLWDEIKIPIRYGVDIAEAKALFQKIADELLSEYASQAEKAWSKMVQKFHIENAMVKPMISLIANENWIEFTVRYVTDYKKRRITKDRLFSMILKEIEKTDGNIVIAGGTIGITELPGIDIKINNNASNKEE